MVGGFAFRGVGIVFHFAGRVEDHCGAFVGGEGGPGGKSGVAWIAGAGKVNPRFADLGCKVLRFRSVAGHVLATLGVVETEGEFGAVEGAWPAI